MLMLALVWSLLVFGVLAALAAWATEQARWLLGASRRLPWLVALIATAAWPLIQANIGQFMLSSPTTAAIQLPAVVVVSQAARIAATSRPWLAQGLVVLWGLASLVLLARLVRAARAATSALHTGERAMVDGAPVVLSDAAGPAVVGWVQPHVLWPRWLDEVDPSLCRLILQHEREHCRAHDPRWLLAAECAVVLMPWHPAVWWMRNRLRAAIELDCDARVLTAEDDASRYGRLLMLLAQRQPSMPLASMLAEPHSLLSRRIRTMTTTRPQNSRLLAAALSLVAVAAIVTACSSALNSGGGTAPSARQTRPASQVVQPAGPANAYLEYQLEEPVRQVPGTFRGIYPAVQKAAGIECEVLVQFIVGADGAVEAGSFKVLKISIMDVDTRSSVIGVDPAGKATNANNADITAFEAAVRDAIATARYVPGTLRGTPVRQLVQQPFVFAMAKE
ncbi:MAG: hypothetical protein C0497_07730 [Gemmatimonas sp.]|nr:hypothetical protein [Gemmatimonas sp.]